MGFKIIAAGDIAKFMFYFLLYFCNFYYSIFF